MLISKGSVRRIMNFLIVLLTVQIIGAVGLISWYAPWGNTITKVIGIMGISFPILIMILIFAVTIPEMKKAKGIAVINTDSEEEDS